MLTGPAISAHILGSAGENVLLDSSPLLKKIKGLHIIGYAATFFAGYKD